MINKNTKTDVNINMFVHAVSAEVVLFSCVQHGKEKYTFDRLQNIVLILSINVSLCFAGPFVLYSIINQAGPDCFKSSAHTNEFFLSLMSTVCLDGF